MGGGGRQKRIKAEKGGINLAVSKPQIHEVRSLTIEQKNAVITKLPYLCCQRKIQKIKKCGQKRGGERKKRG